MTNMTFNDKYFPPIVPAGDTYMDFTYYTYINGKEQKLLYVRPYFEIKTKGITYWWWYGYKNFVDENK